MSKKLTENHPLFQKVNKLEKFMNELGISFDWDGYHMNITDTETLISVVYRDGEDSSEITTIPYGYKVKLVIE